MGLSDLGFRAHLAGLLGLTLWSGACGSSENGSVKQSLPCDVERIVVERCQGCHTDPTLFGAPMPLVTWSDFHAPLPSNSKKHVYQAVSDHIHGKLSVMPPAPNPSLSSVDITTLDTWLHDGAPSGSGGQCDKIDAGTAPGAVYASLAEPPDDCEKFYEFHAHDVNSKTDKPFPIAADLGNGQNAYQCFYFAPPYGADAKALWLHSLVDNKEVLHHWILYGTDNATHKPGTTAPCTAAEAGAYFIAGWAPGGGDFVLPSNVAMDLPSGDRAGLILEVHYFNAQGKAAEDHSGVRLCTAKQGTREHTAAVHFTGSEGICLNPGQKRTISGECDPRKDKGDIHIIGVWPHMHKLGRRMRVSIERANGKLEVVHDKPFEFSSQIYYPQPVDKWVLHPGDQLRTECFYENDTANQVHFGERTQDEMCYGFITAWPAGALENDPNSIVQSVGGPFQQRRRCLNAVSILESCHGLSDFPSVPQQ